jgi:hypothetical protein
LLIPPLPWSIYVSNLDTVESALLRMLVISRILSYRFGGWLVHFDTVRVHNMSKSLDSGTVTSDMLKFLEVLLRMSQEKSGVALLILVHISLAQLLG